VVSPNFPRTSLEAQAYASLLSLGLSPSSLNTGCHHVSYSAGSELPVIGKEDSFISRCETWTHFSLHASLLSASSLAVLGNTAPWFYSTENLGPHASRLFQELDAKIAELRDRFRASPDASLEIAQGLYNWVTEEWGVSPINQIEENGLLNSLENRRANCSEFFSIFKIIFERAGLQVAPIFVFESATGDGQTHIASLFQYQGRNYLMDPLYHSFHAAHRNWVQISLREFWAWHFNNRAFLAAELQNLDEMNRLFQRAESLDPYNPHFPNNFGLKLQERGNFASAEQAYQRALQIDPNFIEPYINLGALFIEQEEPREALIYLQKGLQRAPVNSALLYNLALANFNLGRILKARQWIDQAIAYSPRPIPESYLSLQKDLE